MTRMQDDEEALRAVDPSGLIREAYAIEGITIQDCRVIFFDWAISHRAAVRTTEDIDLLLSVYGPAAPDHPMTQVLREGQGKTVEARGRRGGSRARRS